MESSTFSRFKRVLNNIYLRKTTFELDMVYIWLIQNHIRMVFLKGLIVSVNFAIFRRVYFPQCKILVNGFLRNLAFDFLPALAFINYQLTFKMIDFSIIVDYLNENEIMSENDYECRFQLLKKERQHNVKYFGESQFWH